MQYVYQHNINDDLVFRRTGVLEEFIVQKIILWSNKVTMILICRYIRSINRQNLAYKLAPNHLVDLTDEEYDGHAGEKNQHFDFRKV